MPEICVAHLVREKNGIGPFKRFMESYDSNRGGIEHDLLIVFKGFHGGTDLAEYDGLLKRFPHKRLFVKDFGFDIRPYFVAARAFDYKYFCFLNSYSVIMDKEWLLKMYRHVSSEGVGIVGATGSYQSMFNDYMRFFEAWKKIKSLKRYRGILRRWFKQPYFYLVWQKRKLDFPSYPNYHIRTNAFMLPRDVMLRLRKSLILRKFDAYRFESGRNSLTRQVMRLLSHPLPLVPS